MIQANIMCAVFVCSVVFGCAPSEPPSHTSTMTEQHHAAENPVIEDVKVSPLADDVSKGVAIARSEQLAARGKSLADEERFEEALDAYSMAVTLDSGNLDLRIARVRLLSELRRFEEAIAEASLCVDMGLEPRVRLFVELSQIYGLAGNKVEYLRSLTKAIELAPDDSQLLERRADAFYAGERYEQAIEDYSKAIKHARFSPYYLSIKRSSAYVKCRKYDRAIEDVRAAAEVKPPEATSYAALSLLLASVPDGKLRNGKDALVYARQAAKFARPSEIAFVEQALAAAYAELGEFEFAIQHQEQAIKEVKDRVPAEMVEQLNSYRSHQPWRIEELPPAA